MHPIILLGPTAAGKSSLAIELAEELNGEIISADSMQVYRGMDIGTAKPTLKERKNIPHHLIDIRNPNEAWTAADFVEETTNLITHLKQKGKAPLIVGGTGLYLWTLVNRYSFPGISADKPLREKLEKIPLPLLYEELAAVDPCAARKIHPHDKKRIIRALEVYKTTGQPISALQKRGRENLKVDAQYAILGLAPPREQLYLAIEKRVDKMIKQGLIEEVKGLINHGYSTQLPSMQALGYKECAEYLAGRWSKEELAAELKKRTRRFARRQMTWFKRFSNVNWFIPPVDPAEILGYIKHI
jgi:tRNA dimethylallyltransferase